LLASDGELYGHHKPLRDRFLQHLVNGATKNLNIHITYPARWLRHHNPRRTIPLQYNTSWSCHHGVARWSTGCTCTSGDASWKQHLRTELNRLAKYLDEAFFQAVLPYVPEPWELRNRYIEVILGQISISQLLQEMAILPLSPTDIKRLQLLLEAQFERQRMFTSCGWFFDDFNRIEPKNVIAYAAQAVWLTAMAGCRDLSEPAINWLRRITSQSESLQADQVFLHHLERAKASHLESPTRNLSIYDPSLALAANIPTTCHN